jgi:hypothetical protein
MNDSEVHFNKDKKKILHECGCVNYGLWLWFICPHCDYQMWIYLPDGDQFEILGKSGQKHYDDVHHYGYQEG